MGPTTRKGSNGPFPKTPYLPNTHPFLKPKVVSKDLSAFSYPLSFRLISANIATDS